MKTTCFLCRTELGRFSKKYPKSELGNNPPNGMIDDDVICTKCYDDAIERARKARKKFEEDAKQIKTERFSELKERIDQYKPFWDKTGVIQFKNERIAILRRTFGLQVEFIIAFDDLTKEGYRLMIHDEGKEAKDSVLSGGIDSYFYFQKKEYIE
jgi:hypothetical protein